MVQHVGMCGSVKQRTKEQQDQSGIPRGVTVENKSEYDQEIQQSHRQTSQRHREEESQNTNSHMPSGRQ